MNNHFLGSYLLTISGFLQFIFLWVCSLWCNWNSLTFPVLLFACSQLYNRFVGQLFHRSVGWLVTNFDVSLLGSSLNRGWNPVELGDFLSIPPFVCPFVCPHPTPAWPGCEALRPGWEDLRPGWQDSRAGWEALRRGWEPLRLGWEALKAQLSGWLLCLSMLVHWLKRQQRKLKSNKLESYS